MTDFVETSGNLLTADVDAIVNTVNTVGVMGKGLALQFKKAFPDNFKAYERACKQGDVELGHMFVVDTGSLGRPKWIINFPTKGHWRSKSKLGDIEAGLDDLAAAIEQHNIASIAVPPLGCGNGGLDWQVVEPLIRRKLDGLDTTVYLYPPGGAPAASTQITATERPTLTEGKAALITLLDRYLRISMTASIIEVQKLMYFLQESGQQLNLRYEKGHYGPYADNLRHVLINLEGHHLQGFGDGSRPVRESEPITVLPGAAGEAADVLQQLGDRDLAERIERALAVTEGFESAYGLELLSTVHWCATYEVDEFSVEATTACVQSWSRRKQRLFTDAHVSTAWDHLIAGGWLKPTQELATTASASREPNR